MIPGQLIAPRQLTDLGVNFASVHGLALSNCSHKFFVAPGVTSRGGLPGNPACRGNFSPCDGRTQKLPRGKKNLAHAHY